MTTNSDQSAPNALATGREGAEQFAQLVQQFERGGPGAAAAPDSVLRFDAEMRARGLQSQAAIETPGEPNAADLQTLNATLATVDSRTGKPYSTNPQIRARVERAMADVFAGRRLDRAALSAELCAIAGVSPTQAANPAGADDGAGMVEPFAIPAEHLHGYEMPEIPPGVTVHAGTLSAHLAAARQAGISQQQVAAVIQQLAAQAK